MKKEYKEENYSFARFYLCFKLQIANKKINDNFWMQKSMLASEKNYNNK
jgi:hypothetical protein